MDRATFFYKAEELMSEENGPRKTLTIFFEIEKDDIMHAKIVLTIHKVLGRPVFVTNIPGRTALEKV